MDAKLGLSPISKKRRILKYVRSVAYHVVIWFVSGLIAAFGLSPEALLRNLLGEKWAENALTTAPAYLTHEYARWAFVIAGLMLLLGFYAWRVKRKYFPRDRGEVRPPQGTAPAYAAWDDVEELELFQAACLWAETEPVLPVPSGVSYARLRMFKEAIRKRELYPFVDLRGALKLHAGRYTPNVHTVVTRKSLRDFAKKRGHRPPFLYPEERHSEASKRAFISARKSRRAMISGNVVYGNRPLLDADGSDDLTAERNLGVEPRPQQPSGRRDMTACEVISYLVNESEWGRTQKSDVVPLKAKPEFDRAARDGDIEVEGRPQHSAQYQVIDRRYWETAGFDISSYWEPTTSAGGKTEPKVQGAMIYVGLRVNRRQVEARWPRADN